MRIHGIVDKIEDDVALVILDDDRKINIPIKYLPSNIAEEDVIDISLDVDKEKTIESARKLKKMMEESREED
jgi:preprotein translocase subunit YajC